MTDEITVEEHRRMGIAANNRVWALLESETRSEADDREMVHAARASLWHWLYAGDATNEQRGEWLVSRVHSVLGNPGPALHHAQRCLEITETAGLEDFDRAYAYEAMARALARGGNPAAAGWKTRAETAGAAIADDEDRAIFEGDLAADPW
jgi:hypothetical protein